MSRVSIMCALACTILIRENLLKSKHQKVLQSPKNLYYKFLLWRENQNVFFCLRFYRIVNGKINYSRQLIIQVRNFLPLPCKQFWQCPSVSSWRHRIALPQGFAFRVLLGGKCSTLVAQLDPEVKSKKRVCFIIAWDSSSKTIWQHSDQFLNVPVRKCKESFYFLKNSSKYDN